MFYRGVFLRLKKQYTQAMEIFDFILTEYVFSFTFVDCVRCLFVQLKREEHISFLKYVREIEMGRQILVVLVQCSKAGFWWNQHSGLIEHHHRSYCLDWLVLWMAWPGPLKQEKDFVFTLVPSILVLGPVVHVQHNRIILNTTTAEESMDPIKVLLACLVPSLDGPCTRSRKKNNKIPGKSVFLLVRLRGFFGEKIVLIMMNCLLGLGLLFPSSSFFAEHFLLWAFVEFQIRIYDQCSSSATHPFAILSSCVG